MSYQIQPLLPSMTQKFESIVCSHLKNLIDYRLSSILNLKNLTAKSVKKMILTVITSKYDKFLSLVF